jgi:hypothetical protein
VIPTVILVGLVVGRWWLPPAAAVVWVALLLATGAGSVADVPVAVAFALVNAGLGVLVHKALAAPVRRLRARRAGSA